MTYYTTCITLGIQCFADFLMSFGEGFLASVAELLGPVESCYCLLEEELDILELDWNFCFFPVPFFFS